MKQTQRDIKYIIKRILIGVGIALILFNLKKCNVYAETTYKNFQLSANRLNATWIQSSGSTFSCNYSANLYTFEYNDVQYNICVKNFDDNATRQTIIFNAFEYNNEVYVSYYKAYNTVYNNLNYFSYNLSYANDNITGRIEATTNYGDNSTGVADIFNIAPSAYQQYGNYNNKFVNVTSFNSNSDLTATDLITDDLYKNLNLIYTSTNKPIYINSTEITLPDQNPLQNYTRVDLTGHQAILIVPKNYSYLASEYGFESDEPNANNPQIHYNIGYEKCVKPTLIEINNLKNFSINTTLNSDPTSEYDLNSYCSDEPTLYTQNYPIENIRSETQPAYFYMAILVYNNSKDYSENTPNWIETQQNPYGQAYVYVEEEYYNYYLVDDFSTFSQTLSYTDFELENQTTNINSLPTFNGLVDGSLSSVDTQWGQQMNYQYFLDFVKFPFNFLKSFITGTCEPITLPLPYLGNMQLPCMSTIYSQHVSSSLITLLSAIINGLIFWRCTLVNIVALQDLLQPEDTELEVWNL